MGLFKPSLQKMFERGDVRGLIKALDDYSSSRSVSARHYLTLLGEDAIPLLMAEICDPPVGGNDLWVPSPGRMWARVALEGMGETAVPYLMDAIREGDVQMAKAAVDCLAKIEKGGVNVIRIQNAGTNAADVVDEQTTPVQVIYPDDVKIAYEQKVGQPLPS